MKKKIILVGLIVIVLIVAIVFMLMYKNQNNILKTVKFNDHVYEYNDYNQTETSLAGEKEVQ